MTPEELMKEALKESQIVERKKVAPNPRVGAALLTCEGALLTAAHQEYGKEHAEVLLIQKAKEKGLKTQGAQLAVTLEPCSHRGKTGPCAEAVLEAGFSKIFVAVRDPNPKVSGQGLERLRSAGKEVHLGILEKECSDFLRDYLFAHKNQYPYLHLKMATTLDGLWWGANGNSQWITGEEARNHAHHLRADVDLILTSSRTVQNDNPRFTARPKNRVVEKQPDVFVLRSQSEELSSSEYALLEEEDRVFQTKLSQEEPIKNFLKRLFIEKRAHSVLLEAGPLLSTQFLNENLAREIHLYYGARFLGCEQNTAKKNPPHLSLLGAGNLPGSEWKIHSKEFFTANDFYLNLRV